MNAVTTNPTEPTEGGLVFRHAAVDAVCPGKDAAVEILQLAEALLAKELDRLGAAHAAFAMHDHLAILVQFAHALGELWQRDQCAAGDAADLELLRIADVEDEDVVTTVEALLQV